MQQAQQGTQRQLGSHSELQRQLETVLLRAETAEATVRTLRSEAREQERRYLERIEQLQRKQLPPADDERNRLSGKKDDKHLPPKKGRKQLPEGKKRKQLPAKSGFVAKVGMVVAGAAAGGAAMLGLGKLLGPGDRKRLPPKEVGPTFDVIPVVERKRLPPKRDD